MIWSFFAMRGAWDVNKYFIFYIEMLTGLSSTKLDCQAEILPWHFCPMLLCVDLTKNLQRCGPAMKYGTYFFCLLTFWFLLFSPFQTSWCLATSLVLRCPWIRLGMAANAVQTDRSAERPWHRTQITSYRDFQNEWLCHCVLIDVHQAVLPLASQQVSLKAKIEREDFLQTFRSGRFWKLLTSKASDMVFVDTM